MTNVSKNPETVSQRPRIEASIDLKTPRFVNSTRIMYRDDIVQTPERERNVELSVMTYLRYMDHIDSHPYKRKDSARMLKKAERRLKIERGSILAARERLRLNKAFLKTYEAYARLLHSLGENVQERVSERLTAAIA